MKTMYPKGLQGFLDGTIDYDTDDIRAVIVNLASYTYNAAHDNLDDIPGGARIAVSGALSGKTVTDGVADAADLTIASVAGDGTSKNVAVIVYQHTGTEGTSRLISYVDEKPDTTQMTLAPDGNNVQITWDAGTDRVFRL